jgi:hypothetical protein
MTDRLRGAGKVTAFVLVQLLVIAGLIWGLNQLQAGADERVRQASEISALQAGLDEANERLEAEGEPPVPVPEPADPGSGPPVVPVGPTNAELDAALERYCDTRDCTPGPTRAQVSEALTDLCSEIRCRGADGKDSTVPGPPPTAAQMDAAQARYCDAHNECQGPAGLNGINGTNGADGRGLLSMQCATGGWIIKYTDGIGEPDGGPCRGPQGVPGTDGHDGKDGADGTAKPGTYACPDGETVTGFTVAADGAVTLSCQAFPAPPTTDLLE